MDRDLQGQDQRFRGMKRLLPGRMFDLLSAGDSGRHNHRIRLTFDSREETSAPDRHRDVVVFFLEAKGSRHAAAARIDFFDGVGQRYRFFQETRSNERLLVTMPVNQRL